MPTPRFDWVRSVMYPVIAASTAIGAVLGAAAAWPDDWAQSASRSVFWDWTCGAGFTFGFFAYAATGFVGLVRWWREA